jgi:hypothetical protein
MATADYLHDLGDLLWQMAEQARRTGTDDYERGRAFGLYEAVALMEQQASAVGMSNEDVGLAGRLADDLLHDQ